MSKKMLFVVVLLACALVLSGCLKKEGQDKVDVSKDDGGIVSNIKDALTKNKKMECTTTFTEDGQEFESKSYVQGDKFKSETEVEGGKFYTLFDGDMFYSWGDQMPQGTKMSQKCLKEIEEMSKDMTDDDTMDEGKYETPEDWVDDPDVDVKCKSVLSIDFTAPSDVTFVDQCEMMKGALQAATKLQETFKDFQMPDINQ